MTSSPEQEIPQEVVDKAFEWTLDGGCIGIMDIGDPYYRDLRREIIAGLLAAVLPDLQRPLLEEIERLEGALDAVEHNLHQMGQNYLDAEDQRAREFNAHQAWQQMTDEKLEQLAAERDGYLKELGEVNIERQRQEVRAIEAERERDARPDLTAEETSVLLESTRYAVPSGVSNEIVASARAKLERSLDAVG